MADNYIEKREAELRERRPKLTRVNKSIDTLLRNNRSYRGYAPTPVTEEQLRAIVGVYRFVPSGMNAQPLRFRLVTGDAVEKVHPLVKLGAALPQEHLPHPGTEPRAYIVICAEKENRVVDMDLGIAGQSMLLKAVDMGLNGIFILNFNPEALQRALDLPLRPLAVIGLGKGIERIFIVDKKDSLSYYREDGIHYVPKLSLEDVLI